MFLKKYEYKKTAHVCDEIRTYMELSHGGGVKFFYEI